MRFFTQVERNVVKRFVQKDTSITCPTNGEYYAILDSKTGDIISVACIVDHMNTLGIYRIQGMRTAPKERGKGYSTYLLRNILALSKWKGKHLGADANKYSKPVFEKLGFDCIGQKEQKTHTEYVFRLLNK